MSDTYTNNMFHYFMKPEYWDIEEHDIDAPALIEYIIDIDTDGVPRYITDGEIVPSRGIFVLDVDDNLYMASRKEVHHSDFMNGLSVRCAGEYGLNRAKSLAKLSNKSGHYKPSVECLEDVISAIRENGYEGAIKVVYY